MKNELKKSFFEWVVDFEEKQMETVDLKAREVFLDILKNKPEIILQGIHNERRNMLMAYMAYNPIAISIPDLEAFCNEWLQHLKEHFLPKG